MPCTPLVSRPIGRTLLSLNRAAWPERDTMMMSSSPLVRRTAISSSSSRMLMAMMPSALIGVLYAANSVFFTIPSRVANTRYRPSLKSRVDSTDCTRSPSRSGRRLTSARPLAVRACSGRSYTFNLYTLPRLVKNSR